MDLLIKSAKVVDPASKHNGKTVDILIRKGKIEKIGKDLKSEGKIKVYDHKGLCVSPGWFDMNVNFREPGYEQKEDLMSGIKAAAQGGFTGVACKPSTNPPLHTKAEIEFVKNKTKNQIVDVFPIGTVSKERKGKELAEMFDMHNAGAVAFSDGKQAIENPRLLSLAMLYTKGFNGLIISFPDDARISASGKMNEGETSTTLGIQGMPAVAEELQISRDIFLAEYNDTPLHISSVSTAKSVDLIRQAKKKGLKITADVTPHHLSLDDSLLTGFDSNYKVKPPLRGKADIKALVKGLNDGTIDVIASDHSPEDEENKKVEFDYAAFGIIGLETSYAIANTGLSDALTQEQLIEKTAINPRKILNLDIPSVNEGNDANLTLFNPTLKWTFTEKEIRSKSKNTPFTGKSFTGKALAIYNNGQFSECG